MDKQLELIENLIIEMYSDANDAMEILEKGNDDNYEKTEIYSIASNYLIMANGAYLKIIELYNLNPEQERSLNVKGKLQSFKDFKRRMKEAIITQDSHIHYAKATLLELKKKM